MFTSCFNSGFEDHPLVQKMKKERTEPTNNIRKHEKINTETKQTKVKIKKTDNLNILW